MVSETLTPFFMLASYVIKLVLAFANLGLDIVVYQQRTDANYSIVGLAIDCGLLYVRHRHFCVSRWTEDPIDSFFLSLGR